LNYGERVRGSTTGTEQNSETGRRCASAAARRPSLRRWL